MSRIMRRGAVYTSLVAFLAAAALFATACASPTGGTATSSGDATVESPDSAADDAEELARSLYGSYNTGDVDRLDAVLAPDWDSFPVDEGQEQGPEPFKAEVLGFRETFPDLRVDVDAVHVGDDGSVVTVRTTFTGTQEGDFLDVPATGEEISFRTTDIHELGDEGRRIATTWHLEDLYSAYQQALAASEGRP